MSTSVEKLRERLAEIDDVNCAAELLGWDQNTKMPPRGGEQRAEVLGTLGKLSHEMFVGAETGKLIEAARSEVEKAGETPENEDERALLRLVTWQWEKARRVPSSLAAEQVRAASTGQEVWVEARRTDDFALFAPHLERNLALARDYTDCFDEFDCRYDALLDDYEPKMTAAEVNRLFTELRDELVPLIAEVTRHSVDDSPVHGSFAVDAQRQLVKDVITLMGFDEQSWRFDDAVHPFATSFGNRDVRITDRWEEEYFPSSLYGGMHECGHGLYEAGIADHLMRTPLGHAVSLGVHESQSRLWENMVGRGRAFSPVLAPMVTKAFGTEIDADTLFRAVNRIQPTFIRVEADEATYALHIILRFELEQELLDERLAIADLPEAWNARMRDYLGIDVPSPAKGVLQDVHWSAGLIGYFPTYALGNMIAGQLWQKVHEDRPGLDDEISAGELQGLREWLRENVHRHGSKYTTTELLQRVVGGPIEVGPFVGYLKAKLSDVYQVALA